MWWVEVVPGAARSNGALPHRSLFDVFNLAASSKCESVFKNSLFGCSGSGSAVLAIGSGSGFRVYPILDPSPTPKNPNPEIYPDRGPMRFFQRFFGFPRRNSVKKVAPRRPAGAAALPGQVHKKPAKICPGACVFPLLCIVLSPAILEPEIPISQAPKTAGFVPDFASTTGHSIPDPDDPETRFTRKKRGSRP